MWILVTDEMPLINEDVLIYSTSAQGYAVAITRFDGKRVSWFNATSGLPFPPFSVTHWQKLPPPPDEFDNVSSGYSGYGSV